MRPRRRSAGGPSRESGRGCGYVDKSTWSMRHQGTLVIQTGTGDPAMQLGSDEVTWQGQGERGEQTTKRSSEDQRTGRLSVSARHDAVCGRADDGEPSGTGVSWLEHELGNDAVVVTLRGASER